MDSGFKKEISKRRTAARGSISMTVSTLASDSEGHDGEGLIPDESNVRANEGRNPRCTSSTTSSRKWPRSNLRGIKRNSR